MHSVITKNIPFYKNPKTQMNGGWHHRDWLGNNEVHFYIQILTPQQLNCGINISEKQPCLALCVPDTWRPEHRMGTGNGLIQPLKLPSTNCTAHPVSPPQAPGSCVFHFFRLSKGDAILFPIIDSRTHWLLEAPSVPIGPSFKVTVRVKQQVNIPYFGKTIGLKTPIYCLGRTHVSQNSVQILTWNKEFQRVIWPFHLDDFTLIGGSSCSLVWRTKHRKCIDNFTCTWPGVTSTKLDFLLLNDTWNWVYACWNQWQYWEKTWVMMDKLESDKEFN